MTAPAPKATSWRPMLLAIPRRNAAATVQPGPDGLVRLAVPNRTPRWLLPPLTWIIRLPTHKTVELDTLGSQVWTWCDGAQTVEAIVEHCAAFTGLSFHEARVVVTRYLATLVKRGVLALEYPRDAAVP
jgi:hypothetical protein